MIKAGTHFLAHIVQLYCNTMASRVSTTLNVTIDVEQTPSEKNLVRKIANSIIEYIEEHPMAMDTARGIAEWWVRSTLVATSAAIELLQSKALLISTQRNGQILFSRNPAMGKHELDAVKSSMNEI